MKKILIMLNSLDIGGSQTYVITLTKELINRGYTVWVCAKDGELADEIIKLGGHIYIPPRFFRETKIEKKRFIKAISYNLIFIIPIIFKIHIFCWKEKFSFIISQQPLPTFTACLLSKMFRIPMIYIVHGTLPNEFPPLLYKQFRYKLPRIVVISKEIKNFLIQKYGLNEKNIQLIINCIDIEKFNTYKYHFNSNILKKTIVYISNIHLGKIDAIQNLILAAPLVYKKNNNISFCLVGKGNAFDKINKLATEVNKKIGEVIINCVGGYKDVRPFIQKADIFIGIGRSAREAMAMGIPTILVGHLKGENGGNYGGIIDKNNIEAMEFYNLSGRHSSVETTPQLLAKDILYILQNKDFALKISAFELKYINDYCSSKIICDKFEIEMKDVIEKGNC